MIKYVLNIQKYLINKLSSKLVNLLLWLFADDVQPIQRQNTEQTVVLFGVVSPTGMLGSLVSMFGLFGFLYRLAMVVYSFECRSLRGRMFEDMRSHLTDIHKYSSTPDASSLPNVQLLELLTDTAGIVREKSMFRQYMNICYKVNSKSKNVWIEVLPHP